MHIHEATEANASLLTSAGKRLRTVSLTFGDGRSVSARIPKQNWHPIVSIVLRKAPADLKKLTIRSLRNKPGAMSRLPVCAETLSLLRLLQIVEGLDLQMAERVADAWNGMPLRDRVAGHFRFQDPRVVHAQLFGLNEQPSPMITSPIPQQFQSFLYAAHYGRYALNWRTADTILGSSCLVFVSPVANRLAARLAISNCAVSYPRVDDAGLLEAYRCVQDLIDQVPTVIGHKDALGITGWHPAGHDVMEIVDYLEDLKSRIGDARL